MTSIAPVARAIASHRAIMLLGLTANAYLDFLQQYSSLIRDPISNGLGVRRGSGEPVLLVPGYIAGDWTLGPMARWLKRIGYRPYLSGIDFNVGCPKRKLELITWRVERIARETNARVSVIGHSLGGVLGRALACSSPNLVSHVIALGSPVRLGLRAVRGEVRPAIQAMQAVWQMLSRSQQNCGTELCECSFFEAAFAPTPDGARFSAIFTRGDEVVDWESCREHRGSNYEVRGRHASLIVNREVYRIVASILASDGAAPGKQRAMTRSIN